MKTNRKTGLQAGIRRMSLLCLAIGTSFVLRAQAPTSLNYPTTNIFVKDASSVYIAPSVVGNVSSYSISPALPAGLSFNTNTGVISGTPTAGRTQTAYTITATGGSPAGSTTKVINLTVTDNVFNNNYSNINFGGTGVTRINKVGDGTNTGDVVLYQGVATLGANNTPIDCIITTGVKSNVSTFDAFDQDAPSGTYFSSNEARFFSPQFSFSAAGYCDFRFQFILGGSFVDGSNAGSPVILQNVRINTYDIDGNGGTNSNQYNEFGGFTTSELNSTGSNLGLTYNATTGLTRYRSATNANTPTVTDPTNRVRVTYNNISDFNIRVGADGGGAANSTDRLAYFFLDFGAGIAFTTTPTTPPTIDLNTTAAGVNNDATGCGAGLAFTGGSSLAAVNTPTDNVITRLTVSIPVAQVVDGTNEIVNINGAGTQVALASNQAATAFTLSSVGYSVAGSLAGGVRTLTFTRPTGTFTTTNVKTILDALQYVNNASLPSRTARVFTVNAFNAAFRSPDALFTATPNCVSVTGNIWHDADGLSDNTVNASGTPSLPATVYAVLVGSTGLVQATKAIDATTGAYDLGRVGPGVYDIFIYSGATPPAANAPYSASVYPVSAGGTTYQPVGENVGTGAGNDLLVDGRLRITLGSEPVSNANFGLDIPPVTANKLTAGIANPGGFNGYALSAANFTASDEDGSYAIRINSFPTGANYIKIGSTYYTNGGTCPPQTNCTAWSGPVSVPSTSINTISVDPALEGTASIVIDYSAVDAAGLASTATATLNFLGTSYYTVSGNVWNDANGNGTREAGTENLVNPVNAGQNLYAVLVQTSNTYSGVPTVFASSQITNPTVGYTFTANVPAGNTYEVRLISAAAPPDAGTAASLITQTLPTGWSGVSYNKNNVATTVAGGTFSPALTIPAVTGNLLAQNFGIERRPTADGKSFNAPNGAFTLNNTIQIGGAASYGISANSSLLAGPAVRSFSGTDPEDCATASSCAAGRTFVINAINTNTRLYYDVAGNGTYTEITTSNASSLRITNFDPSRLMIYGQRTQGSAGREIGFTYRLEDAAGVVSDAVNYGITTTYPLPVALERFTAAAIGTDAALVTWHAATEQNMDRYTIERSEDARDFIAVGQLTAKGSNSDYQFTDSRLAKGTFYYRLRMQELGGAFTYSKNAMVVIGGEINTQVAMLPNPASDNVVFIGMPGTAGVQIFDMAGKLLFVRKAIANGQQLDITSLMPGAYIVTLTDAAGASTHFRLVKN